MSLSNGRHILAIPGPSVIPDRVLNAMHRAAPNIYTGELIDMTATLVPDLKKIARTEGQVAMYIGNGHAAWEASLSNVLSRGDKALFAVTGNFGHGWAEMARRLGVDVQVIDFGKRDVVDTEILKKALTDDRRGDIKAVLVVQVDTGTSAKTNIVEIRKAMNESNHSALLMVDSIACLGCDEMQMDAWGVDILIAGCQKGLMVPPGMSFVFFNQKAEHARDKQKIVSSYWDWKPRVHPQHFFEYWCGTAPTHHLFGLRVALDMILHEEGLEVVWKRHELLAHAIWAAFDRWSLVGPLELNISERNKRSHAVTSVRIGAPFGTQLRDWLTNNAGVTLGIGVGMVDRNDPEWDGFFRVGHMGHLNSHMVLGTLGAIDSGLKALRIPHGEGALDAASLVCSGT